MAELCRATPSYAQRHAGVSSSSAIFAWRSPHRPLLHVDKSPPPRATLRMAPKHASLAPVAVDVPDQIRCSRLRRVGAAAAAAAAAGRRRRGRRGRGYPAQPRSSARPPGLSLHRSITNWLIDRKGCSSLTHRQGDRQTESESLNYLEPGDGSLRWVSGAVLVRSRAGATLQGRRHTAGHRRCRRVELLQGGGT